ncbi:MAG: CRTAC1 family protein [Planctomycetota bacterium]|nr:MAG: CRTAC1 family protein [Planctomycetota bacterium]
MIPLALPLCVSAWFLTPEIPNSPTSWPEGIVAPSTQDEFLKKAQDLRGKEAWADLIALAEQETDPQNQSLALSFLAIAKAAGQDFEGSLAALKELQSGGVVLDEALPGLGSPMVEVVNAIYLHCWANFDPAFNRKCWQGLFQEFSDSHYSPIAASRLLMAALKEKKKGEVKKYQEFFENRIQQARDNKNPGAEADLSRRYVDGYLRAYQSNERILELAKSSWAQAWKEASEKYSYDGPTGGVEMDPEMLKARRECEIDTDDAFNTIALATYLHGEPVEEGHPLFEMETTPGVQFEDVTEKIGLSNLRISRVAAADFDLDGDPDLSLCGRLFENRRGKFVEISKDRGLTQVGLGSVFGDYDGDGYLDLLIVKGAFPTLYRNLGKRGKYRFEDVTNASGLDKITMSSSPEGAAWVDFDDDGDLDLYFALYENPMSVGHHDILVENLGDGSFADRSEALGIHKVGPFCGRGVSPCDVDGDGRQEIFVSNYRLQPNFQWKWQDEGFVDASATVGIKGEPQPEGGGYYGHTIGSCWGDVDNDGDFDLFSANLAHPRFIRQGFSNQSMLGIQQANGQFEDQSIQRGIRFQETHSDPALVDIDNDGDLDLSLTCIYEGVPSALFQNDGQGNFQPITFRANAVAFHAWGQTWLDFDGDGFLDVIYASSNGLKALRNTGNDHQYIRIALRCKGKDSSAFGAIVRVTTLEADSPQTWVRQLHNARGTTSQDEPVLHFGLGSYKGKVEVEVRWPDSDRSQKKKLRTGRLYEFKQTIKAK